MFREEFIVLEDFENDLLEVGKTITTEENFVIRIGVNPVVSQYSIRIEEVMKGEKSFQNSIDLVESGVEWKRIERVGKRGWKKVSIFLDTSALNNLLEIKLDRTFRLRFDMIVHCATNSYNANFQRKTTFSDTFFVRLRDDVTGSPKVLKSLSQESQNTDSDGPQSQNMDIVDPSGDSSQIEELSQPLVEFQSLDVEQKLNEYMSSKPQNMFRKIEVRIHNSKNEGLVVLHNGQIYMGTGMRKGMNVVSTKKVSFKCMLNGGTYNDVKLLSRSFNENLSDLAVLSPSIFLRFDRVMYKKTLSKDKSSSSKWFVSTVKEFLSIIDEPSINEGTISFSFRLLHGAVKVSSGLFQNNNLLFKLVFSIFLANPRDNEGTEVLKRANVEFMYRYFGKKTHLKNSEKSVKKYIEIRFFEGHAFGDRKCLKVLENENLEINGDINGEKETLEYFQEEEEMIVPEVEQDRPTFKKNLSFKLSDFPVTSFEFSHCDGSNLLFNGNILSIEVKRDHSIKFRSSKDLKVVIRIPKHIFECVKFLKGSNIEKLPPVPTVYVHIKKIQFARRNVIDSLRSWITSNIQKFVGFNSEPTLSNGDLYIPFKLLHSPRDICNGIKGNHLYRLYIDLYFIFPINDAKLHKKVRCELEYVYKTPFSYVSDRKNVTLVFADQHLLGDVDFMSFTNAMNIQRSFIVSTNPKNIHSSQIPKHPKKKMELIDDKEEDDDDDPKYVHDFEVKSRSKHLNEMKSVRMKEKVPTSTNDDTKDLRVKQNIICKWKVLKNGKASLRVKNGMLCATFYKRLSDSIFRSEAISYQFTLHDEYRDVFNRAEVLDRSYYEKTSLLFATEPTIFVRFNHIEYQNPKTKGEWIISTVNDFMQFESKPEVTKGLIRMTFKLRHTVSKICSGMSRNVLKLSTMFYFVTPLGDGKMDTKKAVCSMKYSYWGKKKGIVEEKVKQKIEITCVLGRMNGDVECLSF